MCKADSDRGFRRLVQLVAFLMISFHKSFGINVGINENNEKHVSCTNLLWKNINSFVSSVTPVHHFTTAESKIEPNRCMVSTQKG